MRESFNFVLMHGLGNRFVLVNNHLRRGTALTTWANHFNLEKIIEDPKDKDVLGKSIVVSEICHKHTGIGADGLILVLESSKADYKMRIFNPDGSEAEM